MKPMPPRPLFHGSRTDSAKAVATTASTALPPEARISAPTRAATPFCAATRPPREAATGLRTTQFCIGPACIDPADPRSAPRRVDAGLVERVMPRHRRRLVIRRAVSPHGVDGLLRAAGPFDLDRPVRAFALERAIALVVGRPHQIQPHVLFRDVVDRLVPGLLATQRRGAVGDHGAVEDDAHPPCLGQQIDAVLGLFRIAGGGIGHRCSSSVRRVQRQRTCSEAGSPRKFRPVGAPGPQLNEARQLWRSCGSVIGPHSSRIRLSRNAGLLHTSCSYCWLSRTFCAALSFPDDCAETGDAAAAIHPAITNEANTVRASVCSPFRGGAAQSTIVRPPLMLSTWPVT